MPPEQDRLFPEPEAEPEHVSPYDPTQPETHCPWCKVRYVLDKHGMRRHPPGKRRKCQAGQVDPANLIIGRLR